MICLCFIRVRWHFITFIYTVMDNKVYKFLPTFGFLHALRFRISWPKLFYIGEGLQFLLIIRKFTLYKNLISRNKFILHRKRNKNYRIMLSRNRWNALFTMVWGWLFSSLIWREKQKSPNIRKFNLYYTPTVGAKFILHRKGYLCHDDKNYVSVLNPLQIQCFQGLQGILRFS